MTARDDRAVYEREGIDVVYTWVDGSWPGYAELLQAHSAVPLDLNPNRFRDNLDMLKYSMRSLARFAPWVRRVFVVTARPQVPAWLDIDSADVSLVHHNEIFDAEHLPNFNSLAIVSNLHRIEGLSRRFLYFEDDRLLGRPVALGDFMEADGRIRVFERFSAEDNAWRHESPKLSLWGSVVARSNHLLNERYGRRWHGSMHSAPVMIDRATYQRCVETWPGEVERTRASRFRSPGNIALEHLYPYYVVNEGEGVLTPKGEVYRDTSYIGLDNNEPLAALGLARLRLRRAKFYCMNDNFGDDPNPRVVARTRRYLEEMLPTPSRFERTTA